MRITIETREDQIVVEKDGASERFPLYSKRGLEELSALWIKVQWNELHWRSLSWHGFQIWQLPEDLVRLQEAVHLLKPDVIVETGVAWGGSAVFFASLCRLFGTGRVIAIDIRIPQPVRAAVQNSPYADLITLIEGDSTAPEVVRQVRNLIDRDEKTFFFLDSDHSKAHVLNELNAYAGMVSPGSYIVAMDGVMRSLHDVPRGLAAWREDNPAAAAREFASANPAFVIERPKALFGDEYVIEGLTYGPDAWLKRVG